MAHLFGMRIEDIFQPDTQTLGKVKLL